VDEKTDSTAGAMRLAPLDAWPVALKRGRLFLVAGPCSAETEEQVMETARRLAATGMVSALRTGIWKPRTRPGSFEGIGEEALAWLRAAGDATGLPVCVEAANAAHVDACLARGIDILWIGARTTANPFAVQELADALRGVNIPVMIKNPVSPDLELWVGAIERLHHAGIRCLAALHRGFSSDSSRLYRNSPAWRIPIELRRRLPGLPLLCDPSHICGNRDLLYSVAQEAVDFLYDGLMIEVHPDPDRALSDSAQQITPEAYATLVNHLRLTRASVDSRAYRQQMDFLRQEIDKVDAALVEILAKRMSIVRQMSECKKSNNVAAFQPSRWEEIVRSRLALAESHALSRDFLFGILERIHEEALRQQELIMTDPGLKPG
jgi:chorismate mutase